ncbi:MAG: HAD family phosphatase [Alphaproteobacteria bacterium]|nr:HAD family phosphatase [Alphaproteobacteria bacterium]
MGRDGADHPAVGGTAVTAPLLIFDFDGVLVDSEVMSNNILSEALTALGHPVSPQVCRRRFTGIKLDAVRAIVEADSGWPLSPDFEPTVRGMSHERIATELVVVAGAAALLETLTHRRCVASNSSHAWIERGLRVTGLDVHFAAEAIFSAADVATGKPAPDLFLHAAQTLETDPAHCIVIEDSIPGVQAGIAAGMTVLGFAGASHIEDGHDRALRAAGARTVFDDLSDLPMVLETLPVSNP